MMRIVTKISNAFNNLSMRRKLILTYMLVVFIPIMVVGVILTENMKSMAVKNATIKAENDVDRVLIRIKSILEVPEFISSKLATSKRLESIIYQDFATDWELIDAYLNYREIDGIRILYNEISDIRLFVTHKPMLENWRFMEVGDDVRQEDWFTQAIQSDGDADWLYMRIPGYLNTSPALCMVRFLKSSSGKDLGVLLIKLNMAKINAILDQETFETVIIDQSNQIIAAKDEAKIGRDAGEFDFLPAASDDMALDDIVYEGRPVKVRSDLFYGTSSQEAFRVVSIIPLDEILSSAREVRMIGIFMILASLLLSVGLIFFSSRMLSKRISEISRDMDRVAAGDLAFESAITGNDEIGQLAQDLNRMVKSINVLVHEAYDANFEKNQLLMEQKEIKLAMLANQINPHFLFNALEAVRMKAISLGDRETARIIKLLARLMRINLSLGSELIPLRRELEQVESYLEIQKFRYGSKVDYRINLADDDLLDDLILPLIIQPVVENAFTHGLENKEGPGCVTVDINMINGDLLIRVADDGIGIDSVKLSMLAKSNQEKEDRDEKRIGLRNISQRIMLYYGLDYGLEIASSPSQGTAVTIRIPQAMTE